MKFKFQNIIENIVSRFSMSCVKKSRLKHVNSKMLLLNAHKLYYYYGHPFGRGLYCTRHIPFSGKII